MAFKCDNCSKGIMMGHRVSHAKNRTNHAFRPNLQNKTIVVNGRRVRVKLCTNCIKLMRKNTLAAKQAAAEAAIATV